ncbi:MAG TPA: hypothetical protein VHZ32_13075, partial [Rhizomicrobium sp.]|nr:hypothetical protein [Rhizomicrobium sp.]
MLSPAYERKPPPAIQSKVFVMPLSLDAEASGATPLLTLDLPWNSERGNDSRPVSLPAVPAAAPKMFSSFWMASFEGSDHINRFGQELALNQLTGHQEHAAADYERAAQFQMRTVRESVGWRLSEHQGRFDFSHLAARARAAADAGVQVIWTLLHYGWPDDVDVLSDAFVPRFARYAAAAAAQLARYGTAVPVYAPIHEISYL